MTVSPLQSADTPRAVALYEQAFPEAERRPSADWLRLNAEDERFSIFAIRDDEGFAGFISIWRFADFVYVEHFATLPERRGQGLGAQALRHLLNTLGTQPVVLEIEPPEDALALRRQHFYERCGLHLLPFSYEQPPYRPGGERLRLCMMATDVAYFSAHLDEAVRTLHRAVYGVEHENEHTDKLKQ